MALKALMLRKKIDAKKAELEKLRAKAAEFQTREAELEAAIGEITDNSTDEERATVEAEVEALTADQEANDGAITDLEGEIEEMETELAEEEKRQKGKPAAEPEKRGAQEGMQTREVTDMPVRAKRFEDMNIMERHAFFEDEHVKTFISKIRSIRQAGSVGNEEVLIPETILPYLAQIVDENSKMKKHVNHVPVSGNSRQAVDGGFAEAVWTEAYARLNKLDLSFFEVELDGYKLGGFFKLPDALIEDSDFNLIRDVTTKLGRGIGYAYDKAVFYGTGVKMPLGIVTRLAQTAAPADYSAKARPWVDLHERNIITISAENSTGITLFKCLLTAFGKARNNFSRGGRFWAMNDTTLNKLLVEAMNINSAGNIYSQIKPDGGTMPVIGGAYETFDFIPDNVIIAGYDRLYTMGERKGVQIKKSEHVYFIDDATAVKGTARYDGKPVIPEGFVAIGINNVTPDADMTFVADEANEVTGITLNKAAATVKAGATLQLKANLTPDVDAKVRWASSDETKATVDGNGTVTGVASSGSCTIIATCGFAEATCTITCAAAS